ncbi:MAG: serine hydrolase domain-containing protein [Bryobacteraceae bacterium]
MALAAGAGSRWLAAAPTISNGPTIAETMREGVNKRGIPAAVAIVATGEKYLYTGAFGKRDAESGTSVKLDSIFAIASMTKAITTTAAMQLVEQGKVRLDEPVATYLPQLNKLQVIAGFEADGEPKLRPATKSVTLRHLLTHTSGFAYDTWNEAMFKYASKTGTVGAPALNEPPAPLAFEPGAAWQYGIGIDWAGKLVETVSNMSLEDYFQKFILKPLGMNDTSFIVPPQKFDRLVTGYTRQADGTLKQNMRVQPDPPKLFLGGGGLYSTAADYIHFMQMILARGSRRQVQILKPTTIAEMSKNQIGMLGAGKLKTFRPERSAEVDLHPGATDRWGLGFLINPTAYEGGRSAGSLAWAGINNTFYWIDPRKGICAVLMMQFLPFVDSEAVGLLGDFERAVYANLPAEKDKPSA